MEQIDYINWWESNKESDLELVNKKFSELFSDADYLPTIYNSVLYKYLKNLQFKHWDKETYNFADKKIKEIESKIGSTKMQLTLLSNLKYLVEAYESLVDLEERIMLMSRFHGNEEMKAKIFSVNIYNDLLNTVFSNILKLFITFQGVIENNSNLSKKI